MKLVRDVMTTDVVVARTTTSFQELARILGERSISAVPVLDDADRLVGIVSESDLLLKEAGRGGRETGGFFRRWRDREDREKARGRVASDVMTTPAITIEDTAPVARAARVLHERRVKRLPVVDQDGRVVGIVSRADLLRVFLRTDAEIRRAVEDALAGDLRWIEPGTVMVTVDSGVVTLRGVVEHRSQIPVLVGLAGTVDGVVGIDDRLTYQVDDVTQGLEVLTPWGAYVRR